MKRIIKKNKIQYIIVNLILVFLASQKKNNMSVFEKYLRKIEKMSFYVKIDKFLFLAQTNTNVLTY